MEFKRVVVTGLGALTPIGNSIPEYWEGLINGVSGAALIKSFDTTNFKTKFACEVKNFDADAFLIRYPADPIYVWYLVGIFKNRGASPIAPLHTINSTQVSTKFSIGFPIFRISVCGPNSSFTGISGSPMNVWASLTNRPLLPFRYQQLGEMMTLGIDNATLTGLGIKLDGTLANVARRLAYLYRLPTLDHQLRVGFNWLVRPIIETISP